MSVFPFVAFRDDDSRALQRRETSRLRGGAPRGLDALERLRTIADRGRTEPVLLDFVKHAAIADVQILRGAAAIPTEGIQSALNHLHLGALFHVSHDRSYTRACQRRIHVLILVLISRSGRNRCGDFGFQFPRGGVRVAHDHGLRDEVAELSQVAPPIVKKGNIHQPGG